MRPAPSIPSRAAPHLRWTHFPTCWPVFSLCAPASQLSLGHSSSGHGWALLGRLLDKPRTFFDGMDEDALEHALIALDLPYIKPGGGMYADELATGLAGKRTNAAKRRRRALVDSIMKLQKERAATVAASAASTSTGGMATPFAVTPPAATQPASRATMSTGQVTRGAEHASRMEDAARAGWREQRRRVEECGRGEARLGRRARLPRRRAHGAEAPPVGLRRAWARAAGGAASRRRRSGAQERGAGGDARPSRHDMSTRRARSCGSCAAHDRRPVRCGLSRAATGRGASRPSRARLPTSALGARSMRLVLKVFKKAHVPTSRYAPSLTAGVSIRSFYAVSIQQVVVPMLSCVPRARNVPAGNFWI